MNRFWSISSLQKKIGIWNPHIQSSILPLIQLKSNENIYDFGSGFSPLGLELLPYILPNGTLTGFDNDLQTIDKATDYLTKNKIKNVQFTHLDIYDVENSSMSAVDLVMCTQLLVNLNDYTTALENMMDLTLSSGRILCIENINYGAYIHRPDFSWRANLRLSQIWQNLCVAGKFSQDNASSAIGARLPELFDKLGLHNINYRIISPLPYPNPPYTEDFIRSFLKNHKEERIRLKNLISNQWSQGTDISDSDLEFFIVNAIESEYDLNAVKNNLHLTQWIYPFMVIVGWISKQKTIVREENLDIDFDI